MTPTLTALVQLGRELRLRPAKPADREVRLGDLYLAADQRAAVYAALFVMAELDEDDATGETALHLHDEASRLEDCAAHARLAWDAFVESLPREEAA